MGRVILIALIAATLACSGAARAAMDAGAGKDMSASWAMCHGPEGQSTQMARLASENPTKVVQALDDFKSGKRDNAVMKAQASGLSADDGANLAACYASLK
jgi:cytochrome c553